MYIRKSSKLWGPVGSELALIFHAESIALARSGELAQASLVDASLIPTQPAMCQSEALANGFGILLYCRVCLFIVR